MPQNAERLAPVSVHWAFVVYFRTNSAVTHGRVAGRVEHIASGQATHFASLEELLTFIDQVLANVRAPPRRRLRGNRFHFRKAVREGIKHGRKIGN